MAGSVTVWDLSAPARPAVVVEAPAAPDSMPGDVIAARHGHAAVEATAADGSLHASYDPAARSILIYEAVRVGRPGLARTSF